MSTVTPTQIGPYFGIDVPFMEHIGLEPLSLDETCCRTQLAWNPAFVNSRGDTHGGRLMSALDFTLSAAARAHDPMHYGALTIDLTTHFLEASRSDLMVVGRCTRRGKAMAFCEGEIVNPSGTVVAVARGVFKLVLRGEAVAA